MAEDTEAKPDRETLIAMGRRLLDEINAASEGQVEVKSSRITNLAQLPTIHGLSRHAQRLATVVLDLYERGLTLEAMPLVRATYELAITAQWAADSREGISALYNEEMRHRRALAQSMRLSVSKVFQEAAPSVEPADWQQIDTVANAQGRYFEQRCVALAPAGHHAYALYRAMSAYCHPSASVADHYLQPDDGEAQAALCWEPEQLEHDAWLFLTVASIVWSATAVDVLRMDRPARERLRAAARELGVPDVLRLSHKAQEDERKADQRRRRSQWKGRKKRSRGKPIDPSDRHV